MIPGVVFDCMVFVQALANANGPAYACYELVRDGRLILRVSPEIIGGVGDVLGRPKVRRKRPALTHEAVEAFLQDVLDRAAMLPNVPAIFRFERDPKDEPYINLAIASVASYLVSRDGDLLDLMDEEGFRNRFPRLTILEPPALLRLFSRDSEEIPPE